MWSAMAVFPKKLFSAPTSESGPSTIGPISSPTTKRIRPNVARTREQWNSMVSSAYVAMYSYKDDAQVKEVELVSNASISYLYSSPQYADYLQYLNSYGYVFEVPVRQEQLRKSTTSVFHVPTLEDLRAVSNEDSLAIVKPPPVYLTPPQHSSPLDN